MSDPKTVTTNGQMRQFATTCTYFTRETTPSKIVYARNAEDAEAIARLTFVNEYTEICLLESVKVKECDL
jgi:hypothetical protein